MKLKVFDRILLGLLIIVAILSALVLFGMSVNLVTFDMATAFLYQFYAVKQNMLILAGSGLVILLIALKLLFAGRGDKKANAPATALVRKGEIGGTFIALSAIDLMIKKFCAAQANIKDCQSSVKNGDDGVTIGLRLSVSADNSDVVSITSGLQNVLKTHIETLTGVSVKEISILVEDANVEKIPAVAEHEQPVPAAIAPATEVPVADVSEEAKEQ